MVRRHSFGGAWLGGQRIGALMPELLDIIPTHALQWQIVPSTLVGHAWIWDITDTLMIPVLI
jgi:hypothetical protein